ncbi:MAG TPA: hypothetical protein H9769_00925 [Candidatus Microbacterium pullistercoris]|nr:hypothetical protein [Candidatus Microbacterium pullistercoris]
MPKLIAFNEEARRGLAEELGVDAIAQSADFDEQSEGGLTVVVGLDRLSGD